MLGAKNNKKNKIIIRKQIKNNNNIKAKRPGWGRHCFPFLYFKTPKLFPKHQFELSYTLKFHHSFNNTPNKAVLEYCLYTIHWLPIKLHDI
jgi:hypothetical protein